MRIFLNKKNIVFTFLFAFLIVLDQLSKFSIRHFGGFYLCNEGVAFGISGLVFWIILIFILIFALFKRKLLTQILKNNLLTATLILAGAFSNLLDRLIFNCVIDFIDFKFWPVFNLADVLIVTGAIIISISFLKKKA